MTVTGLLPLAVAAWVASAPWAAAAERIHKTLASPLVEEGTGPDGCEPELSGRGGPVKWEVRIERHLPDGKSLVETSRQPIDHRFPLCISDLPAAKNAEIELQFVTHTGSLERTAGIVLRFADAFDYYLVRADALANNVRLYRVTNGTQQQVAGADTPVRQGRPQTLKVRAVEDMFTVWLNGSKLFEQRDTQRAVSGRFGIWSKSDSVTSFGDLFVTMLD